MKGHPPAAEGGAELNCFLPRNEGDGHVGILGQGDGEEVQSPPVLVPTVQPGQVTRLQDAGPAGLRITAA